jgi:hypothetical protein
MPWYSFVAKWPDGRLGQASTTRLSDHEMAYHYARLVIQELRQHSDYNDPELKMIVKDGDGEVIHMIAF